MLAVMFAPIATREDHQDFVAVLGSATLLSLIREAEPARVSAALMPAIVAAAAAPRVDEFLRQRAGVTYVGGHHKGRIAAQVLLYVLSCAEYDRPNATQEHAYQRIQEMVGRAGIRGASRSYLASAWRDYQGVAHLWAAHVLLSAMERHLRGGELAAVLALAEALRTRGEANRPRNQPPLLDATKTWKVPERFDLPEVEIAMPSPAAWAGAMAVGR